MVWVVRDDIENLCDLWLVDVEAHHGAEVLRDELIGPAMCAHERGLPGEKVGDAILLKTRPLQLVAGASGIVAGGHVGPVIHVLSPVVQEPSLVQRLSAAELLLQTFYK